MARVPRVSVYAEELVAKTQTSDASVPGNMWILRRLPDCTPRGYLACPYMSGRLVRNYEVRAEPLVCRGVLLARRARASPNPLRGAAPFR